MDAVFCETVSTEKLAICFFINPGEIWVSTSVKHPRSFTNKIVKQGTEEFVISFKVKVDQFQKVELIPQKGSKNKSSGKNIFNYEKLTNHPCGKYNIGIKGHKNVKLFNKAITEKVKFYRVVPTGKNDEKMVIDDDGEELRSETSVDSCERQNI